MMRFWLGIVAISVLVGAVTTGVAQLADVGARQYAVTCAGCHGADGSGSLKGPAIGSQPKTLARSDDELTRIVREGVPGKGMPPAKALGDEKIAALVRYLRVLQGTKGDAMHRDPATMSGASDAKADPALKVDSNRSATVMAEASGGASVPEPDPAPAARAAEAAVAAKGNQEFGLAASLVQLVNVLPADLLQTVVRENWTSYNGDYSGRRFSSMNEVTPANVKKLAVKWVFPTTGAGVMEVTPVVVAGVMFVTRSNDVWAVDAKTGKALWHHTRAVTEGLIDDASGHINRGVAVLGTRVYMETDNAHLVCLDARTGDEIWDIAYATGNKNYGATSAPLIVKDKVLVGTSGGDDGVRGFVAAYDATTGKQAWRFWTIPGPGEKGSESWPGDASLHGGGTTWMPGTYDPELNTIYWGTGNPSPDFDGSVRPGDNLYTSSLLALNPDTGKLKWYFQFNPHDTYDYDAEETPVLVDANFGGQPRKLVVTANRNGFLYVLDRVTGEYLASKQFSAGLNWAKGIDAKGRPISNGLVPNEKGVTVCPSVNGATNWYSPSYSPATKMFYFRSLEQCSLFKASTETFVEGQEYYSTGAERPLGEHPESAWINAFDVEKMDFAWREEMHGDGFAVAGVMSTAGGLVAFGNDAGEFEMDDAGTGKKLWSYKLPAPLHASPMGFGLGGRQYFAVAAGDDVIAFGMP